MSYPPFFGERSLLGWIFPPPAPIRIAHAEPADTARLAEIHAASFRHDWSADELAALIGEPQVICLVAKRANALGTRSPIGFVLIRLAADEAEILTIAVNPRRRARGTGRTLMRAGIDYLIRRDVARLFLEVDVDNAAALALYRRLGFIQVGKRKGYYEGPNGASSAALIMRLDLM